MKYCGIIGTLLWMGCDSEKSPLNQLSTASNDDFAPGAMLEGVVSSKDHDLSALNTLERDLSFVNHYYVDSNLLNGDLLVTMLESALNMWKAT